MFPLLRKLIPLLLISGFAQAQVAEFYVDRGKITFGTSDTTKDATDGTDYDEDASNPGDSSSFVRIVNVRQSITSTDGSTGSNYQLRKIGVRISNPGTWVADGKITFVRDRVSNKTMDVYFEIVQYIGAASGANEIINRKCENLTFANDPNTTVDGASHGAGTNADVVVFPCGWSSTVQSASRMDEVTVMMFENNGSVRIERGTTGQTSTHCYCAVEFTGSNWAIQQLPLYSSAAVTINDTGNVTATAFDEDESFITGGIATSVANGDEIGFTVEATSPTNVAMARESAANGTMTGRFTIVESTEDKACSTAISQKDSTSMTDTGEPDTDVVSVTDTRDSTTDEVSLFISGTNDVVGTALPRGWVGGQVTASNAYTLYRGEAGRVDTVIGYFFEWPRTDVGGCGPPRRFISYIPWADPLLAALDWRWRDQHRNQSPNAIDLTP